MGKEKYLDIINKEESVINYDLFIVFIGAYINFRGQAFFPLEQVMISVVAESDALLPWLRDIELHFHVSER